MSCFDTLLKDCEKDFIGKTIVGYEAQAVNELILNFSDGTSVTVMSEPIGPLGLAAMFKYEEEQ